MEHTAVTDATRLVAKAAYGGACPAILQVYVDDLMDVSIRALNISSLLWPGQSQVKAADAATERVLRPASLADVPVSYLWDVKRQGFDCLFVQGVWAQNLLGDSTGWEGAAIVTGCSPLLGGDTALCVLKAKANKAGMRLLVGA